MDKRELGRFFLIILVGCALIALVLGFFRYALYWDTPQLTEKCKTACEDFNMTFWKYDEMIFESGCYCIDEDGMPRGLGGVD